MLRRSRRDGAPIPFRRGRSFLLLFLLFVLAGLLAAATGDPGAGGGAPATGPVPAPALAPGDVREGAIAAAELHAFRVTVSNEPLLAVVEQRGIDLVVTDRPAAAGAEAVQVDAPNRRWGPEVLLLAAAGEHRIEIRAGDPAVPPGRYAIRLERLAAGGPGGAARRLAAAAAMARASRPGARTTEALHASLATYRDALAGWTALGDRALEAEALLGIAWFESRLGERRAASDDYERALALWRAIGDRHREADTLDRLGLIRLDLGQSAAARAAIAESLAIWRRLGERFEEGSALVDAGFVEQTSGTVAAALPPYEQARSLLHELGARRAEARVLNNLGGLYDQMGEADAALAHYGQALALRRAANDLADEAQTLCNIAVVDRTLGDWQAALDAYGQASAILAPLHQLALSAVVLNNLGYLYYTLGEPERARGLFDEALALRRAAGDRRGEIVSLNNLGLAWRGLGDLDRSLDQHRQALAQAKALGEPRLEMATLLQMAETRIERRDPTVLPDLRRALALLADMGDRQDEAFASHLEGRALAIAARPGEALSVLQHALERFRSLRDRADETAVLEDLAAVERGLGRRDEARAHAAEAVAAIESLRSGLGSLRLRASFLATRHRAFMQLIDLLMERHFADPRAGFDRMALEVSERARARSLLDYLDDGRTRRHAGAPAALAARRRTLLYQLSARADRQDQLLQTGAPARGAGDPERDAGPLLTELDAVEAQIRALAPGKGTAAGPAPLGAEAISRLLDPGTLLLEIALGEDRSYAWAVDGRGIRSVVLPGEGELDRLARRLYQGTSTLEAGGRRDTGDGLARVLLEPFWSEIQRAEKLVIVPDAALNLVPWSALPVPLPGKGWGGPARTPLVEEKEVVEVPSATTLAIERQRLADRPAAARWAAVFADPVFAADDPRVSRARRSPATSAGEPAGGPARPPAAFARLPATRREAAAITGLAPPGQTWKALDFAANREALLSGDLAGYRILHFATHAIADIRNPELSGLVLSQVDEDGRPRAGFLRAAELQDLDLAADLVVISGCQTALGKEVRGEGLLGLTRAFAAAGVPRVVGSLWRVEDRATAEIMTRFYGGMWRQGLRPAAALRAAQRALRRDPRYRAPHFWAGFVHQGDWR